MENDPKSWLERVAVGVLVLDAEGREARRTARVEVLVAATVLADPARLARRAGSLAERCQAVGEEESETFEPIRGQGSGVKLTAAPLPDGGAVISFAPMGASDQVEERVRQFVGEVAHDLRTPLTSILGASDLLLSGRIGEPDERHKKLLTIVGEGGEKLSDLLTNLATRFLGEEVRS